MKTILERIIAAKSEEVAHHKRIRSLEELKSFPLFEEKCHSLKQNLLKSDSVGIIAEFKRKSPSKGEINVTAKIEEVTKGYVLAGASGLSILTDDYYFGGSLDNLEKARNANRTIPILRKDFILDPYQVYETKAYGADVILLIGACLDRKKANHLADIAKALKMEVLFEIHQESELEMIPEMADFIGVNNRNLKTMEVNPETSFHMAPLIPDHFVRISESGLEFPDSVMLLKSAGYRGFLIGESFMKTADPAKSCRDFIERL